MTKVTDRLKEKIRHWKIVFLVIRWVYRVARVLWQAPMRMFGLQKSASPSSGESLVRLEGSEWAKFLLPIDYAPSRNYVPRWGYSRPVLQDLYDLFAENIEIYKELVAKMREHAPSMREIPLVFHERNLPMPAWSGVAYAPFDALVLHTLIQIYKPNIFLEIGSGISTCFARYAADKSKHAMKIVSIDPEPRAEIDAICDLIIREPVENVDQAIFENLEAGDIVFMDGSHRSFMNSDVTVFFLEILDKIPKGVLIHIHDITLPWDYPPMFASWYWNEQYLLAAIIKYGKKQFVPLAPTHFMCKVPEIRDSLPAYFIDLGEYNDGWLGGGAMWLKKI